MVLVVANIVFPPALSPTIARKNIELLKKYPDDPSLGKTLAIGVKPNLDGMHILAVGEVKRGKVEKFMKRLVKIYQEYTNLDGFKYQVDVYLDVGEAYDVLGMDPPPEQT